MAEKEPRKLLIYPHNKNGLIRLTYDEKVGKCALSCSYIPLLIGKYTLSYSELIEKGKPSTQTCTTNYVPAFEKLFNFDRCEYVISNYAVECSKTCVDNGDGTPDKFETVTLELPVVYTSLPWVDTVEECKGTGTLEDPFNFLPSRITLNKDPLLCNNHESLCEDYICYVIGGGRIPDDVVRFNVTYNYNAPPVEFSTSGWYYCCPYYVFNRSDHYTVDKKWPLCGKYFNINLTGNNTNVGQGFYNSYLKDCIVDTPIKCTLEDCVAEDPINCTIIESPEKSCETSDDISNCIFEDLDSFVGKTGSNVTIYAKSGVSFTNCTLSNVTIIGTENRSVSLICSSINFSSAIFASTILHASNISGNFDITSSVTAYGNSSCECDGTLSATRVYGYGGSISNVNPDVEGYIGEEVKSVDGYFIPQSSSTYLGQKLKANSLNGVEAYDCDIEYSNSTSGSVDASWGHILACTVNATVSTRYQTVKCTQSMHVLAYGNIYDSIVHVDLTYNFQLEPGSEKYDCGDRPDHEVTIVPHYNSLYCRHPCIIGATVHAPSNVKVTIRETPPEAPDCYPNRISCSTSE